MHDMTRILTRVGGKVAVLTVAATVLGGCLGAMAVPLLTTAGATAVTTTTIDRRNSYVARVSQMNCSQLRSEYARLERDTLGRVNPLAPGDWSARRTAVLSVASERGCTLPG